MAIAERRRLSTSDSVEGLNFDERIRRLEQWSSLDSCIIPNRTRIPSSRASDRHSLPGAEDLQIAFNLLQVESKVKGRNRERTRTSSSDTRSSEIGTIVDSDPFRSRTSSCSASTVEIHHPSFSYGNTPGSVIVHSKDLAILERVLRRHSIPYYHHDGGCDQLPSERHIETCLPVVQESLTPVHDVNNSNPEGGHNLLECATQGPQDKDKDNEREVDILLGCSQEEPKGTSKNLHNEPPAVITAHIQSQNRLRSSATCPVLRIESKTLPSRLPRSSKNVVSLMQTPSIPSLQITNKDHAFKGQGVKDLVRKLGVDLVDLPGPLCPVTLGLPICYARPLNYLIHSDVSATRMITSAVNQKLVTAYCSAFTDLMRSVQEGEMVLETVAGDRFPRSEGLSKFEEKDRPAEVWVALIRMLSDLPKGIIGCVTVFNAIYLALQNWHNGRCDLDDLKSIPLARFIAKVLAEISDVLQLHLVCALFGLMHDLDRTDGDADLMAHAIAPVMLNKKLDEIELSDIEIARCKRPGPFKRTWRKMLGLAPKDSVRDIKLGACQYVAAALLKMWASILKEMRELQDLSPKLEEIRKG